tara:strand:- start:196 stop:759 length:564 start_codon:yes stop_codon:yes gene_type:complete
MKNKLINKVIREMGIDYVIYGNFNFIPGEGEDLDLLIKGTDYPKLISFLEINNISFHKRKYYPNQIFITGTEIKLHIADDLYIGGRRVAYLIKLFLINDIFLNKIKLDSFYIIDSKNYLKYRYLKKMLNPKKDLKIEEYPLSINEKDFDLKLQVFVLLILSFFRNVVFIPFRFIKKRIWVRLLQYWE